MRKREIQDAGFARRWRWRVRYGDVGEDGLGTGVGAGVEGESCGREGECEGGRWMEVDERKVEAGVFWIPGWVEDGGGMGGGRGWCSWCGRFCEGREMKED